MNPYVHVSFSVIKIKFGLVFRFSSSVHIKTYLHLVILSPSLVCASVSETTKGTE